MMQRWIAIIAAIVAAVIAWIVFGRQPHYPVEVCCLPDLNVPKISREDVPELHREILRRSAHNAPQSFQGLSNRQLVTLMNRWGPLIYGPDRRSDLASLEHVDPRIEINRAATVIIVHQAALEPSGGAWVFKSAVRKRLREHNYEGLNFCSCEKFSDKVSVLHEFQCSGFLIDSRHIVTASHCVPYRGELGDRRFVFGFYEQPDGAIPAVFSAEQVRTAHDVVYRSSRCDDGNPDLAVIELDEAVTIPPVTLSTKQARYHDRLYMIGYPLGLPATYAPDAFVRDDKQPAHIIANLDGEGGNSGSPVFDEKTHQVIGVHVHGEVDIAKPCGCWTSTWCPDNACWGEEVTRIEEIQAKTYDIATAHARETEVCSGPVIPPRPPTEFQKWLHEMSLHQQQINVR
jgi:hypothetical protein